MPIILKDTKDFSFEAILALYRANRWSAARKPEALYQGLLHTSDVLTAWDGDTLVGLGSALSDGYLVVYYPHLLVLPEYQKQGIGRMIMMKFQEKYGTFHQQILVSDGKATEFYQKCGFKRAGDTQPMWMYGGDDH
jgi:GNAT superfamily N-acetyltransferase